MSIKQLNASLIEETGNLRRLHCSNGLFGLKDWYLLKSRSLSKLISFQFSKTIKIFSTCRFWTCLNTKHWHTFGQSSTKPFAIPGKPLSTGRRTTWPRTTSNDERTRLGFCQRRVKTRQIKSYYQHSM